MHKHALRVAGIAYLLVMLVACTAPPLPPPTAPAPTAALPTAVPPTTLPATAPATAAPTTAAITAPTAALPTTAPTAAMAAPTAAGAPVATVTAGQVTTDVVKLINDKFNKVDRSLALWNIQPGLGTVMIEYGNRFARLWYAVNAGNWDMAKYQLDEMTEIQEVGETTRPARSPMLKAFEDSYLKKLDSAIAAKDKAAFTQAFNDAATGCNACHTASTAATWKSYKYVNVQTPKTDPASYIDWKGAGQGNHIANPPPAATTAPTATVTSPTDLASAEKLINDKFNNVDRSLALWNIQPGLGTVMIEYGNRYGRLYDAAKAGNWDMAKYQLDEMIEIQEVGETTRPARAPMLKAFEQGYLTALDKAIAAKDGKAFDSAFATATDGCNACHAASKAANWKSYNYVKIQVPTANAADYLAWKAPKGTGNYIANPLAAATATAAPAPTGAADAAAVEKLINDKFNKVDRSLALWNIQPGLGTVMIEYGRRFAQLQYAIAAGNWDMAKYQLDEMIEIQEVGETTRPSRSPMLKAYEEGFLKPLDDAIMAQDKTKAAAVVKSATDGCNACHVASKSANWASYGYVDVQMPQSDPADYLQWKAAGGTGNYVAPAPAAATPAATSVAGAPAAAGATPPATSAPSAGTPAPTSAVGAPAAAAGAPPPLPADHAGRTVCLACHSTGVGGAPKLPTANPDHSAFKDDNNATVCLSCHVMKQ